MKMLYLPTSREELARMILKIILLVWKLNVSAEDGRIAIISITPPAVENFTKL